MLFEKHSSQKKTPSIQFIWVFTWISIYKFRSTYWENTSSFQNLVLKLCPNMLECNASLCQIWSRDISIQCFLTHCWTCDLQQIRWMVLKWRNSTCSKVFENTSNRSRNKKKSSNFSVMKTSLLDAASSIRLCK